MILRLSRSYVLDTRAELAKTIRDLGGKLSCIKTMLIHHKLENTIAVQSKQKHSYMPGLSTAKILSEHGTGATFKNIEKSALGG